MTVSRYVRRSCDSNMFLHGRLLPPVSSLPQLPLTGAVQYISIRQFRAAINRIQVWVARQGDCSKLTLFADLVENGVERGDGLVLLTGGAERPEGGHHHLRAARVRQTAAHLAGTVWEEGGGPTAAHLT